MLLSIDTDAAAWAAHIDLIPDDATEENLSPTHRAIFDATHLISALLIERAENAVA